MIPPPREFIRDAPTERVGVDADRERPGATRRGEERSFGCARSRRTVRDANSADDVGRHRSPQVSWWNREERSFDSLRSLRMTILGGIVKRDPSTLCARSG